MNFNFKKKYGQNFLQNKIIINKIVNLIDASEDDLIIEIGPGAGALTKELKKYNCKLISFEIDEDTKEYLLPLEDDKTKIIYDDFLNVDINQYLKKYKYNKLYIIGNLPYYITTPIITKIIDSNINVDKQVYMVQKEVADRFSAKPGSKEYGSITVFLNYFYEVKKEFIVGKGNFKPQPKVDSAIVSFKSKKLDNSIDIEFFKKLVKDSFQFKRKTIRNNLKEYDLKKVEEVLNKYNFDLSSRAEELPLNVFIELVKVLLVKQ